METGILFENSIENFYENIPLVNLLELPVYKGYNLNENAIRRARYFFLLRKIHSLEKQYDIGCYYIHYLTNAFQLRDFIEISDKKIFIHCHGYDITWNLRFHHMPEKMYHQDEYIQFCNNISPNPVLIANSLFSKNLLLEKNLSENRIKVLHFGAPIEGFSELKDNAHVKILYLGRLVDFKGPD